MKSHRILLFTGTYMLFLLTGIGSSMADSGADTAQTATETTPPTSAVPGDVRDLPLTEIKQDMTGTDKLGILISGDGGWWALDNGVSEVMAAHGIPMIGVSSHTYFATPRTPESTTADMARVLRHYLTEWKKERIVLMGYSLGAEIIPFVAARLPEDLRARVAATVMIAPSKETMFEFHTSDWIHTPSDRQLYPVQPEIEKLYAGAKLICTTSESDTDCICSKLDTSKIVVISRKGDHHYGGDFKGLGDSIWEVLKDVK